MTPAGGLDAGGTIGNDRAPARDRREATWS